MSNRCFGCMELKGEEPVCPHCGYDTRSGAASGHHLPPGTILQEKYLIGKVLGQGGFGITYLAFNQVLDLKLAIKEYFPMGLVARSQGSLLLESYAGTQSSQFSYGLQRFLDEAKTLARFSEHPNIVSVRDFFEANQTAYMVMNYIEGQTFEDYLNDRGGIAPFSQVLQIMMPVLDALREVHRHNIMHRDVSPDNIFIRDDSRVLLIDFGAARQEMQQLSRQLSVIMKVGYSPEEQYRSKGEQGPWTDVYAAAATFYRALTGQVPPEAMDRLHQDTLTAPSELGVDITPNQEAALLKALAVKAPERYQRVEEFQEALLSEKPLVKAETAEKPKPAAGHKAQTQAPAKSPEVPAPSQSEEPAGLAEGAKKKEKKGFFKKPLNVILTIMAAFILLLVLLARCASLASIDELRIEPEHVVLCAGEEGTYYKIIVKPDKYDPELIEWDFDESNSHVATLFSDQFILPVQAGTRTITARTKDGKHSSTCIIEVVNPTITWEGGTYVGEATGGVPDGDGAWFGPAGDSYLGTFQNGQWHGFGAYINDLGYIDNGFWINGERAKNYNAFLDAHIADPVFFESGYNLEDQSYSNNYFSQETARYISFEVRIDFGAKQPENKQLNYTWTYFDQSGSVYQTFSSTEDLNYLEHFYHGFGWDEPGNWPRGLYKFNLDFEGNLITTGYFQVY